MGIIDLIYLGAWIYGYCTDFVINTANMLGLSYYEVNAGLFVFLWPMLTVGLVLWASGQEVVIKILEIGKRSSK